MAYSGDVIGARLKALRKEWGYSLEQVAEACGVQQYQTVSKWESANTIPSMKQLLKLCNLYCCDVGYLLGEYDCKTRKATDIQEKTGLSEAAIERLEYLAIFQPDMMKTLNLLIEFERADIIKLINSFLQFNFTGDIECGNLIFDGRALDNHFLMELNAELKAMKKKVCEEG